MPGSTAPSAGGTEISAKSAVGGADTSPGGADSAAGATPFSKAASAASPTRTEMIGVPTSAVVPSATSSLSTTPAYGLGSSTTAFAVSISTMIWLMATVSPGSTSHLTMSASVRPSPTSGSLNCFSSDMRSSQ